MRVNRYAVVTFVSIAMVVSAATGASAASVKQQPSGSTAMCPPGKILSQSDALNFWGQHPGLPEPGSIGPNGQPIVVVDVCGQKYEETMPHTFKAGAYANLDLAHLSTQQLRDYGIPLPNAPKGSAKWQAWLKLMTAALPKMHSDMPLYLTHSFPEVSYGQVGSMNDSSWAGYIDANNQYNDVYSEWYMPTVSTVTPLPDQVGEWVGLGGVTNFGSPTQLFQAGTASTINTSGANQNYAWFEYVSSNSLQSIAAQPLGNVATGDLVFSETWYEGGGAYDYDVYDITSGESWTNTVYPGWTTANNNSAEVVTEDPLNGSGSPYTLPSFNYIQFTSTTAEVGTDEESLQYWPYYYAEEHLSSGGHLTPTTWITNNSFDVNYGDSNSL